MATVQVSDIVKGAIDSTGSEIVAVYGKVSGRYAVYRNAEQVTIQYSDTDVDGINQRAVLASLFPTRSRVSAMVSNLRSAQNAYQTAKADEYDRRLASALLLALQGDASRAQTEINAVLTDLSEDAASDVRTRHLVYATLATIAAIIISKVLAAEWFSSLFGDFSGIVTPNYWTAAAVGAIGALFSIALALRERSVPVDLQPWDNASDAILRIFVGAVSGVILIALLQSELISLSVGKKSLDPSKAGIDMLVVAAFAGGFIQRFVADFLNGFSSATSTSRNDVTANSRSGSTAANETNVTNNTPAGQVTAPREIITGSQTTNVASNPEAAIEPDEHETEAADVQQGGGTTVAGPVG